jgi:hypothetical protein
VNRDSVFSSSVCCQAVGVPHIFLSLVSRWFANEVGLCVSLALYLWQYKNFVWLFENMVLLVECVRFV